MNSEVYPCLSAKASNHVLPLRSIYSSQLFSILSSRNNEGPILQNFLQASNPSFSLRTICRQPPLPRRALKLFLPLLCSPLCNFFFFRFQRRVSHDPRVCRHEGSEADARIKLFAICRSVVQGPGKVSIAESIAEWRYPCPSVENVRTWTSPFSKILAWQCNASFQQIDSDCSFPISHVCGNADVVGTHSTRQFFYWILCKRKSGDTTWKNKSKI